MRETFHNIGPGPEYALSRSAVDMLFWGAVLVSLGYLVGEELTAPSLAPHANLGRMVLMVGGCSIYGWLARSRLWPEALALMILAVLQVVMMAGGMAIYTFELFSPSVRDVDVVIRAKSLLLGVDFALVLVLVILLRAARRESHPGFILGLVFFGSMACLCIAAPFVFGTGFWQSLPELAQQPEVRQWFGAIQVALVVFSLIPLVKTHRMLRGHEGRTSGPRPSAESSGGDGA